MQNTRSLEVVFLTNFANSSYRAIPALAQMADELDTHITILHATGSEEAPDTATVRRLWSFFPDAGTYHKSSRVVFPGSVVDAVKDLARRQPVDLVVAPSADPLGWPRPFHISLRAKLLDECAVPIWTMGPSIHKATFKGTKNVGCWIDLAAKETSHIAMAFEYAARTGAKLHLLHALPEIDEGAIALPLVYDKPLSEEGAGREIRTMIGWLPVMPEIHVATGSSRKVLPRMAQELNLDIAFVGKSQTFKFGSMIKGISSAVDRCPCPVICGSAYGQSAWRLRRGAAFTSRPVEAVAA